MKQCIECKRWKDETDFRAYDFGRNSGITRKCTGCINRKISQTMTGQTRTDSLARRKLIRVQLAEAKAAYQILIAQIKAQ